jgi:competence protein ComEA
MNKRFTGRLALIIIALVSITLLPGCGRNRAIEITVPPSPAYAGGRIFITGRVNSPGLYPCTEEDSLRSVLLRAGGILPGADFGGLKLHIPVAVEGITPQKIDINRAEAWLLAVLPGIGEVLAERIVTYRATNGLFRDTGELKRVEGIGEVTFGKIKTLVTVAE